MHLSQPHGLTFSNAKLCLNACKWHVTWYNFSDTHPGTRIQLFTLSAGKFWSNASYPVNIGSSVYVNTRQRPQFDATVCVVRTQESSVHFKRLSSREAAEAQWLYWAELVSYELPTATPKVITRHSTIDHSSLHHWSLDVSSRRRI
jgi:hypothetical protein